MVLLIDDRAAAMVAELELNEAQEAVYSVTEFETDVDSDDKEFDELCIAAVLEEITPVVELILFDDVSSAPSDDESDERLSEALARRSSILDEEREYTADRLLCDVIALSTELMEFESELLLDSRVVIVELSLAIPELSDTMLEERLERLDRPAAVPELIEELIEPCADSIELWLED